VFTTNCLPIIMYSLSFSTLLPFSIFFFFNTPATTEIYTLSLHDALPISQDPAGQPQPLAPALYDAELAAIGERLSSFLHTLDSTPRYTIQHRVAEYQQALETQYGSAAETDVARLAVIQPSPQATALHEAVRQALAIMQ